MKSKEIRSLLAEQMKLVKEDAKNIPQAESIANLTGKTIKLIQAEIALEVLREKGKTYGVLSDMLGDINT